MYRANISFTQLNDYIGFMLEIGLLEKTKENNRDVYRSTDRGKDFLQYHRQIAELLKDPEDRNVKTIVRKPKFLENR